MEGRELVDLDFFSVSDPICSLQTRDSNVNHATWHRIGETEVIDNNLNPKWIKSFSVWFHFTKDLDLRFMVHNYNDGENDDMIGMTEICLTEIMMADKQQKVLTLELPESENKSRKIRNRKNRGSLLVKAGKVKKTEDIIKFQISA